MPPQDSGPWDNYKPQQEEQGPWSNYGSSPTSGTVSEYPNLKTGAGMINKSVEQARTEPSKAIIEGPESQGAELMAHIAGQPHAPTSNDEAVQQLKGTIGKMGELETTPYLASIPGPGGKGPLISQVLKGAGYGAGVGALEHGLSRAWQGRLPDLEGTARAAGTGGLTGAVIGPVMNSPAVREGLSKVPYLRRFIPETPTEEPWEPSGPSAGVKKSLGYSATGKFDPNAEARKGSTAGRSLSGRQPIGGSTQSSPAGPGEAGPLRPLIGSESDWRTFDQRMGILKPEAQTAGTYHAARGGAAKKLTLQERLGRRMSQ